MEKIMNIKVDTFSSWKEKEKAINIAKADKRLTSFQFMMLDTFTRCHATKYKPTISTLMSQFGMSKRNINYTLKKLKDCGYIEIIRQSELNNYNTILYVHPRPNTKI